MKLGSTGGLDTGTSSTALRGVALGRKTEFLARMEFMSNGFFQGTERLENRVLISRHRYDVVSLDLIGPYSGITQQILSNVLLKKRAWVMINLQAAREQGAASEALERTYKFIFSEKLRQELREECRRRLFWTPSLWDRVLSFMEGTAYERPSEISSLRARALDSLLMLQLGMRIQPEAIHESMSRELAPFLVGGKIYLDVLKAAANRCDGMILGTLLNGGNSEILLEFAKYAFRGADLTTDVATARPKVKNLRKYSYVSKMGRKPTTFFTTMAEIHSADYLRPRYEEFRRTVSFYLGCMKAKKEGCLRIELLDRKGQRRPQHLPLSWDDQLSIVGSTPLQTLSFRKLINDLRGYEELLKEFPGSDPCYVESLERIELTAS